MGITSVEDIKEDLYKACEVFYELVFEHEWLKEVFAGVDQKLITDQQYDFILAALGGPNNFMGRNPRDAHTHIFIQEDMWKVREDLLIQAMQKVGLPEDIQAKWLKIDNAFKNVILKKSVDDCFGRYKTEPVINVPDPRKKAA